MRMRRRLLGSRYGGSRLRGALGAFDPFRQPLLVGAQLLGEFGKP
jgi:hypothetical protein